MRASSWAAHRHAADPAYDAGGAARGPGGRRAGAGCAGRARADGRAGAAAEPASVAAAALASARAPRARHVVRSDAGAAQVVEAAGRERFRARAARFEGDLAWSRRTRRCGAACAEALGFRRNTRAVRAAGRCGAVVAGGAGGGRSRAGRAGRGCCWARPGCWPRPRCPRRTPGGRCSAAPGVRRGAAALELGPAPAAARRTRRRRAAAGLAERGRALARAGWRQTRVGPARAGRRAAVEARQRRQRQSARCGSWCGASPWIGRGRAQVIAINVLLPFAAAAGLARGRSAVRAPAGRAEQSRRALHGRSSWAAPGVRFRGACHQQGLLHLFKHTCAARVCERCPRAPSAGARLSATTAGRR